MTITLKSAIASLRRHYGTPPAPVSRDPFALILWEQVGYLVPDEQRLIAFEALRGRVGLAPEAILRATPAKLGTITRLGGAIAAGLRAGRIHQSADRALRDWDGDLSRALALPIAKARAALMKFAMIGEPGADRILLFTRTARLLALDSNALRVLERLGLITAGKDYKATYRGAQATLAPALPTSYDALITASQLLRMHGQELCKARAPRCGECPLATSCPVGTSFLRAAR